MTPEQWQRVKVLFGAALEQPPHERSAFLEQVCGPEEMDLRREVEALLAVHEESASFLETPAVALMPGAGAEPSMLQEGQTIGRYRLLGMLGAGGMGQVYLAEDPRLRRQIALKLLPSSLSRDVERLRRFEQEARAASALSHPNVCVIHEIGESGEGQEERRFIAMEHVPGESLRQRLERHRAAGTRMPLSEVLDVVQQTAAGLAAAHAAGIVHRDVKPENVMIRPDGLVKLLDFGLAKLSERSASGAGAAGEALSGAHTEPGMVLGTVQYMSPEQVRGLPVDERTDVWSLGATLYEMLAGRPAFEGPTSSDIMVAVLAREPQPLAELASEVPAALQHITATALHKEREARYASMQEMATALKQLPREPEPAADAPPPPAREARPHNLPVHPTALIGREAELREIAEKLQGGVRLLTLTGPGGTGKTHLALQAATERAVESAEGFEDGIFFINLAPITDPALVPATMARVLGVKEAAERSLIEVLQEHLREKRMLLLLDNFEQLVEAAPLVADLLAAAGRLKVLVTSRIPLRLRGEQVYPVPPLTLPDLRHLPPAERLTEYAAVRLFLERAQSVQPSFRVTDENAPALAEICHRVDGLPLAIELAATRIPMLPPQAMLARLQNRLKLLSGGARDLPERQQTLRGTIEWSHELLGEEEKLLFRRLSVFAGGRTLEAIEQVCDADGEFDVLEGVSSLVEKSLLRQEEDAQGESRFVMLETIHEYAREKLYESTEAHEVGRRHLEFFLGLAEAAESQLAGSAQGEWFARLEVEHDNLRAALGRAMEQGEVELAGRLAGALWRFWDVRGHYREGRRWLSEVLGGERLSPGTRAKALHGAGTLAWLQGELNSAQALWEESLRIWRELEERHGIGRALNALGTLATNRRDLTRAEALFQEAVVHFRELGETRSMAVVLNNLGGIEYDRQGYQRAVSSYKECLALAREAQDSVLVSVASMNLGVLARREGDLPGAEARLFECLRIARDAGHVQFTTSGMAMLAQVSTAAGDWERAARLFGAADARFALMGFHLPPYLRDEYDRDLAAVRAQLDEATWERAWQEGASMSLEEAIAYALEEEESGGG